LLTLYKKIIVLPDSRRNGNLPVSPYLLAFFACGFWLPLSEKQKPRIAAAYYSRKREEDKMIKWLPEALTKCIGRNTLVQTKQHDQGAPYRWLRWQLPDPGT
jgi:hypothetical protein